MRALTPVHLAVIFLHGCFVVQNVNARTNAKLAKCETFDVQGEMFMKRKESEGMDIWKKWRQGRRCIIMIMDDYFLDFLTEAKQNGVKCETINQDLMASMMNEDESNKKKKKHKKKCDILGTYPTYKEVYDWMLHEHKLHPEITQVFSMGHTELGRRQLVMKISKDLGVTDSWVTEYNRRIRKKRKPIIFIDGGIHAREWLTVTSAIYIIDKLLHADNDHYISQLLEIYEFHICPILNPDGYDFTHNSNKVKDFPKQVQGLDYLFRRLWRKDMSKTIKTDRCVGTDLNRNFGHHWNESTFPPCLNPCIECYIGDAAFSSMASANLARHLLNQKFLHKLKLGAYLSFHTYGQLMLVPWGFTPVPPEDNERLRRIAERMAFHMGSVRGTEYLTLSVPEIFGKISGGSMDWAKGSRADIAHSFSIELFPDFTNFLGFIQDVDKIIPTGKEAWKAVFTLAVALYDQESLF